PPRRSEAPSAGGDARGCATPGEPAVWPLPPWARCLPSPPPLSRPRGARPRPPASILTIRSAPPAWPRLTRWSIPEVAWTTQAAPWAGLNRDDPSGPRQHTGGGGQDHSCGVQAATGGPPGGRECLARANHGMAPAGDHCLGGSAFRGTARRLVVLWESGRDGPAAHGRPDGTPCARGLGQHRVSLPGDPGLSGDPHPARGAPGGGVDGP